MKPILTMNNIVKEFGAHIAVNNLNLSIYPGEIVALLGENGAGKSTLIKILAGIYERTSGDIVFQGKSIDSAQSLSSSGKTPIAFIHQDLGLIEWMTIAENMAFSMGYPRRLGLIDWQAVNKASEKALDFVGLKRDVNDRIFDLSRTEKALLAIARAIAVQAQILVLDEPSASLSAQEVQHLFKVLKDLRNQGVAMIYVTHRLDEVIEISDRLLIMRDGKSVAEGSSCDYDVPSLAWAIVGEHKKSHVRTCQPSYQKPLLEISQIVVGDVGPLSFTLHQGEMIALAGLRGSGQEDIGRLLFGERTASSGHIFLNNRIFNPGSPKQAIAQGIALVAGDRLKESVISSMSTSENLFLNPISSGHKPFEIYKTRQEIARAYEKFEHFDIRPPNPFIDMSALSGGNQQKIVLARWLHLNTPILILEDPSAGVDVGARAEIYHLLNEALKRGVAIIIISTDFEEIANLCSRALVFNRGVVKGELINDELTFANLLALASHPSLSPTQAITS